VYVCDSKSSVTVMTEEANRGILRKILGVSSMKKNALANTKGANLERESNLIT
jgi:hypothetical protein